MTERSRAPVATNSRPDAPDIDDSLRRISVVMLQHIHRGERAALGLGATEGTPPPPTRRGGGVGSAGHSATHSSSVSDAASVGGLSGLMQRFALFTREQARVGSPFPATSSTPLSASHSINTVRERALTDSSDDEEAAGAAAQALAPHVVPTTPEGLYDVEVEADDFHEARYLRPLYQLVQADWGLFSFLGSGVSMHRVRYTFGVPTSDEIYQFMKKLFQKARLTAESGIISLVYIERLMEGGKASFRASNWRPVVLCGLLLASKVWDDLNSWSVEFAAIYPQYTVQAINTMERLFVSKLGFNLFISGSVYARYYFALRALNEQRSFRQRYMNMVAAPGAPVAMVKRIEESSKELRESLYSRSL